ncbi:MAG: methyltransferase domain-containing protein [Anaerolineales bacterium]|nr:methyltransferase domain-containing protein [Anaerolineales bacterium]
MTQALPLVCQAVQNDVVVDLVRRSLQAGYCELYGEHAAEAAEMVKTALEMLRRSQSRGVDPAAWQEAAAQVSDQVLHKADNSFWFNHIYHTYKTQTKPEQDYNLLRNLLSGKRILDYGCGSGYLAVRLAQAGYSVFTTDVLDYRYEEARNLPFAKMGSPQALPYPAGSMDSALVQAVLHHIDPADLGAVIGQLGQIAWRVVVKEDTYNLPSDLPGLEERLAEQPLLRTFHALPLEEQFQALALIDTFSNAIALGIPQMNLPFQFKSIPEWEAAFAANGLRMIEVRLAGFEPGRVHKSCHVWMVFDRAQAADSR